MGARLVIALKCFGLENASLTGQIGEVADIFWKIGDKPFLRVQPQFRGQQE